VTQRSQIYPLSTGLAVGTPVQSPLPWRYYSTVLHCSLYCSLYCWKYYEYCTVLYCTVGDTTVQYCTVGDTYYRTVLYFLLCTGLYCWTLGPGRYHSGPVATATATGCPQTSHTRSWNARRARRPSWPSARRSAPRVWRRCKRSDAARRRSWSKR